MKNYSKGKIYCLVNDDMIGLIYYGSTIQTLKKRLTKHRSDNKAGKTCTSKYLFEVGEPEIILLENYPCKSEKELLRREGYYHRNFECVNENIAGRTRQEYRIDNKELILEYYKDNKELILEKRKKYRKDNIEKLKEKFKCICGGRYITQHKASHFKTKKHKEYLSK